MDEIYVIRDRYQGFILVAHESRKRAVDICNSMNSKKNREVYEVVDVTFVEGE